MIPVIKLTEAEVEWCRRMGTLRNTIDIDANIKDVRRSPDGEKIHVDGITGEFALAKWLAVPVDVSTDPRSGGVDLVKDGFRIDVKSTCYQRGRLLATLKINHEIDIYALALLHRMSEGVVVLRGYAWKRELIQAQNIIDLGRGPGYALAQDRLHEWKPKIAPVDAAWIADYERAELAQWGENA